MPTIIKCLQPKNLLKNILRVFLLTLPFQPVWILRERFLNNQKWQFGTLASYSGEFLILLAAAFYIYIAWKKTGFNFKTKKPTWTYWLSLFALYSFLSAIWSAYPDLAWQKSRWLVETILAFYLIYAGPLEKSAARKWFSAGAIVAALLGMFQFLTQSSFNFKWLGIVGFQNWENGAPIIATQTERWLRAYGSFGSPNIFGGFLVLFIILLFRQKKNIQSQRQQFLHYAAVALSCEALFFSWSRSALAAVLILTLIEGVKIIKGKKWKILPYAIIPLLIFFTLGIIFKPLITTRLNTDSYSEKISYKERTNGYFASLKIIKHNPWLGAGSGNYTPAIKTDQPVHNIFLLFLAEYGLLGLLLLIGLFWASPKANWRKNIDLLALLPIILFDHYLYSTWSGLLMLAIFLALFFRPPQPIPNSSTKESQLA